MTSMSLGSFIPAETTQSWSRMVLDYDKAHKDNYSARNLLSLRGVGSTVMKDTIRRVEGSGGNDYIPAKVTAKGATPETTGVKVREVDFNMYQISVGFLINEKDLAAAPELRQRDVDWCVKNIHRREDYMLFNGDSTINLSSLGTFAATNPNGKIVASGASGSDANNAGAWDGTDTTIDIHADVIVEGCSRLGTDYKPTKLVCARSVGKHIKRLDDMRKSYADEICGEFGAKPGDFSWIWETDYMPAGYAYIIGKDSDAAEFVVAEDVRVDSDYAKQPGGNYYTEIKEWVSIEMHDPEAFVSIATT